MTPVVAPGAPSPPLAVTASVPAFTVVPPAWLFAAASTTVPAPFFSTAPLPEIAPENVPVAAWSKRTIELFVIEPCRLVVVPTSLPADTVVPPE